MPFTIFAKTPSQKFGRFLNTPSQYIFFEMVYDFRKLWKALYSIVDN